MYATYLCCLVVLVWAGLQELHESSLQISRLTAHVLTSLLIYPGAKLFGKRLSKQWLSAEEVYGITGMASCHVKTGAVIGMANHYTILLGLRAYCDGFEPYLGSQPEFRRET